MIDRNQAGFLGSYTMRYLPTTLLKRILKALAYGAVGALVVLIVVFVIYLDSRPDLGPWHQADLDEEFTAESEASSFSAYMQLEQRLFAQLQQEVYARTGAARQHVVNRYSSGSLADPGRWPRNWNRSFELTAAAPRAGILLLHGLSDSPYSMRALAATLHSRQAQVLGLRLPGHGTAPSGLVEVRWEDMAAAVRIAMHHLKEQVGNRPLYIIGYSNGGALALHYVLDALDDDTLPKSSGIALLSPSIGVAKIATLAVWQARLGHLLGLEKLAWNVILPEVEPFKYGSFAVNAGDLVYRLTARIQAMIDSLQRSERLDELPPIVAFQSSVDATVSARAVVDRLFRRLPPGEHELVMFDINRQRAVEEMLTSDIKMDIEALLKDASLPFTFSFVTNSDDDTPSTVILSKQAGRSEIERQPLQPGWPADVYSLSHVALPFPPDDPVYGGDQSKPSPGIKLGNLALRGERGVIGVPASTMLRQRWNPFYAYVEMRILELTGLAVAD
jgi:alpha-beta hydrolase superfamily lysophospholipase